MGSSHDDFIKYPLPVIVTHNKRREQAVPEKVIRELADKCEPPTWAEAHSIIVAGE